MTSNLQGHKAMTTIHVDYREPTVAALLSSAFPGNRGRTVKIVTTTDVELLDMFWDGGSRSTYVAIDLDHLRTLDIGQLHNIANPPQFGGPQTPPIIELETNLAVIKHSISCGKDIGFTIYIHPSYMGAGLYISPHIPAHLGPAARAPSRGG